VLEKRAPGNFREPVAVGLAAERAGDSLTLMSLDGQLEKLSALYAEKSDGELLDLHEQRDGLTELAQQALAGVMRERGLGARGVSAEQSSPSEIGGGQAADALVENELLAYLFHDAFEAREAIRNMTEAAIPYRMLDWHTVNPEMEVSYTGVDLGLVVQRKDASRTMVVLKEKLGLFPAREETPGSGFEDEAGAAEALAVLSMFDRNEALAAAQALGEAGITYLWRDGRDDTADLPHEETVAIEVRLANLERATKLVEEALSALPEDAH
jgi:hypothetical protein